MYRIFNIYISKWALLLLAGDIAIYCLSVSIAVLLNPKVGPWRLAFVAQNKFSLLLVGLTYFIVLYIGDVYDQYKDFRLGANIGGIISWIFLGTIVIMVLFYFPLGVFIGRYLIFVLAGTFALLMVLWRYAFSSFALPIRLQKKVLIVGAGKAGRRILEAIQRRPSSGLAVMGFVDDDPAKVGTVINRVPVLGDSSWLAGAVDQHKASLVVVAITHEKNPMLLNALTRLSLNGCQMVDMPSLYEFLAGKVPIDHISGLWLFFNSLNNRKLYYRHLKRFMDLGLVLLGLLLTWPLFVLIAVAIKLDSAGPIFFRQERLGKDGVPFQIFKFRTMVQDAERTGPQWAIPGDPRITRVGRLLRRLRLDELPQLINIVKGEMSLVGPRPEREVFVRQFQEAVPDLHYRGEAVALPGALAENRLQERVPYYSYRLLVKPGITGWAQVMYAYASSLEETKEKLQYDLYYIKNMGILLDLAILLKTVRIVLFGRGR